MSLEPNERIKKKTQKIIKEFENCLEKSNISPLQKIYYYTFNIYMLVDYLADYEGKSVKDINELDLRIFMYNWIIHKALVPLPIKRVIPESVSVFYEFLENNKLIKDIKWLKKICADKKYYQKRLKEYNLIKTGSSDYQEKYAKWHNDLTEELYNLCLIPSSYLGEKEQWGSAMGIRERSLYEQLSKYILQQKQKLETEGKTEPKENRATLDKLQKEWVARKVKKLGMSPYEAVMQERKELFHFFRQA